MNSNNDHRIEKNYSILYFPVLHGSSICLSTLCVCVCVHVFPNRMRIDRRVGKVVDMVCGRVCVVCVCVCGAA